MNLEKGKKYQVTWKGSRKNARERRLIGVYLGEDQYTPGKVYFSLRPAFGTTPLELKEIVSAVEVPDSTPSGIPAGWE